MGNVVSKGVNELIIPNYKQTWANIRKIADAPEATHRLTGWPAGNSSTPRRASARPRAQRRQQSASPVLSTSSTIEQPLDDRTVAPHPILQVPGVRLGLSLTLELRLLMRECEKHQTGGQHLLSRVFPENAASRALLRRLGFEESGTHRRHGQLVMFRHR